MRCVENEEEVMNAIGPLGFEKVVFEQLSFWQQAALMQNTHCFVTLYGAGLGNLIFMRPESLVIELINKVYAEKKYSFPFWRMANASGVKYIAQFCSINKTQGLLLEYGKDKNTKELDFLVNQNVIIDIPKLLDNISLRESNTIHLGKITLNSL